MQCPLPTRAHGHSTRQGGEGGTHQVSPALAYFRLGECWGAPARAAIPQGHRPRMAGAGGGSRTHTSFRSSVFETDASADSATPAGGRLMVPRDLSAVARRAPPGA